MRRSAFFLVTGICLGIVAWPWAAPRASAAETPTNVSVLPLVLKGAQLGPLKGAAPEQLSALVCRGGRPEPILFQVDELNAEGRVVSRYADKGRVEADDTPGRIDDDDELIVMLRDLGERCPPAALPTLGAKIVQLEIVKKALGKPLYLYLLQSERGHVPPRALLRYVPAESRVEAAGYAVAYDEEQPFRFTNLTYKDLVGRENENLLDRFKVRMKARALKSLVQMSFDEEIIKAKLEGVRVGPLRVTREIAASATPIPGFTVKAYFTYHHYERFLLARAQFNIPQAAALFMSNMDVAVFFDMKDLRGTRLSTEGFPQGVLIDGKSAPQERNLVLGERPWFLTTGNGLNCVAALEMEEGLKLTPAAYFVDDESEGDPPENHPGAVPAIGYLVLGWEDLKARWYALNGSMAFLPRFPEGGGNGFYETAHSPLSIQVSEVKP